MLTRLDPRRAPTVALVLAPLGLIVLIVWLVPEPARLGFAGDLTIYREYGQRLVQGSIPYLDFHVEYPPLALAPMTLPLLLAPAGGLTEVDYLWRFTLMEGVLAAGGGWLIFRATVNSRTALVWWAVLVSVAWASVALRYDLWAVLCVLVAVLVVDRRPGAAGVALGLGTMLKAYPLALLPVLCVWAIARRDWPGLARLLVGCASVVALVMAAAWALAGPDSLQWLHYQADRGLQIESLGAGLLMGLHVLFGQPVGVGRGFGTIQVESSGSDLLVDASPIALVVLLAVVVLAALRRFRLDEDPLGRVPRPGIVLASVAAIAAVLVGSKVLSVQYVIWLVPFVPFLPVPMRWLVLAITALSTAIYTVDYQALIHLEPPWILALVVRNGLLAVLLAWLVAELWGYGASSAVRDQAQPGAES